jgi:ubiquitin-activating enzyme E1
MKYAGPYTFSIGDTSALSEYTAGGIFTQVKLPKVVHFVCFALLYKNDTLTCAKRNPWPSL